MAMYLAQHWVTRSGYHSARMRDCHWGSHLGRLMVGYLVKHSVR